MKEKKKYKNQLTEEAWDEEKKYYWKKTKDNTKQVNKSKVMKEGGRKKWKKRVWKLIDTEKRTVRMKTLLEEN